MKKTCMFVALVASAGVMTFPAHAADTVSAEQSKVLNELLATYAAKAKEEVNEKRVRGAVSDKPFSADLGRDFYLKRHSWQKTDRACANCHTDDPKNVGKHIESKKPIKPLAPAANPERFTDAKKVEKNFEDHCYDLYARHCSAYEKGNFITYLMSVK